MNRSHSGFTLIEVVVVIAIFIALAGVLVPIVSNELDDAKEATAQATASRIATAITQYIKDTGYAPCGANGIKTYHFLHGEGLAPTENRFASGSSASLEDFLCKNQTNTTNWRGPYLQEVAADPWGGAYVVNSNAFFKATERAWVLSCGPNRRVDTSPSSTEPQGDDIAIVID